MDPNMEKIDMEDAHQHLLSDPKAPSSTPKTQSRTLLTILPSFLAGALLVFIITLTSYILHPHPSSLSNPHIRTDPDSLAKLEAAEWNTCGTTSSEAMSLGCVMEPLVYGWMPRQCLFPELTDLYPKFDTKVWYADQNHTHVVPKKDLWAGKHYHIYTERYHTEHCLFQWRKLQYAMYSRKEWLDNKTTNWEPTTHCADLLGSKEYSRQADGDGSKNSAGLGFYICKKTIW